MNYFHNYYLSTTQSNIRGLVNILSTGEVKLGQMTEQENKEDFSSAMGFPRPGSPASKLVTIKRENGSTLIHITSKRST